MKQYVIGLDYGTLSLRGLLLDVQTGQEVACSECPYRHGVMEHGLPDGWALQHPADYLECLESVIPDLLNRADAAPECVMGIGVDFTSSTILPTRSDGTPLCMLPEFEQEPHAYAKLWKHHGAEREAEEINRIAAERNEPWLPLYGGKVSGEWMLPKILETLRSAPQVYAAADRYPEALDWVIWQLIGTEIRSACAAGYKCFYQDGYPSSDFLRAIDPGLEQLVAEKLAAPVKTAGQCAGVLTEAMARRLRLCPGTPVAVGIIDAHASVLGCGVADPGTMMIIAGTSSCHMVLSETQVGIPGVAGVVRDGILPGYYAYEAGQSCVGDLFGWFVDRNLPETYMQEARQKQVSPHQLLIDKVAHCKPGQSGLLALDWQNGVRSPLMDFDLSGLLLGMTLQTTPEEIYLALIEATAYGTRLIIETFEQAGVAVEHIVMAGGIPAKNSRLVQVYADVCGREIQVTECPNASARGAALLGLAAATGEVLGGIVRRLGAVSGTCVLPNPENSAVYNRLYAEYKALSHYFGAGVNDVMKRLRAIRSQQAN